MSVILWTPEELAEVAVFFAERIAVANKDQTALLWASTTLAEYAEANLEAYRATYEDARNDPNLTAVTARDIWRLGLEYAKGRVHRLDPQKIIGRVVLLGYNAVSNAGHDFLEGHPQAVHRLLNLTGGFLSYAREHWEQSLRRLHRPRRLNKAS